MAACMTHQESSAKLVAVEGFKVELCRKDKCQLNRVLITGLILENETCRGLSCQ